MASEVLPEKHSLWDDAQGIVIGAILIAFAINIFTYNQVLSGGAAGIALLGHYVTGYSIGLCYFVINIPFYYLGYSQLGLGFVFRTLLAVSIISFFGDLLPRVLLVSQIDPVFSSMFGSILIGVGFVIVFRHGSSTGGVSILILYLQRKYKLNAGKVQLAIDAGVMMGAYCVVPLESVLYSLFGVVIANLIVISNFKPSRYNGYSLRPSLD